MDSYGGAGGGDIFTLIIGIVVALVMIAGMWKMFSKAGEPGWASIIPFYNNMGKRHQVSSLADPYRQHRYSHHDSDKTRKSLWKKHWFCGRLDTLVSYLLCDTWI